MLLRTVVNASWYIPDDVKQKDLNMPSVRKEIKHHYSTYISRITAHPNELTRKALDDAGHTRPLAIPNKRFDIILDYNKGGMLSRAPSI